MDGTEKWRIVLGILAVLIVITGSMNAWQMGHSRTAYADAAGLVSLSLAGIALMWLGYEAYHFIKSRV